MVIPRKQTLVQLSDELIDGLDGEAERRGVSRSALIREAIEILLEQADEAEQVRRWLDGYRRMPETEEEVREAELAGIDAIREEPW